MGVEAYAELQHRQLGHVFPNIGKRQEKRVNPLYPQLKDVSGFLYPRILKM